MVSGIKVAIVLLDIVSASMCIILLFYWGKEMMIRENYKLDSKSNSSSYLWYSYLTCHFIAQIFRMLLTMIQNNHKKLILTSTFLSFILLLTGIMAHLSIDHDSKDNWMIAAVIAFDLIHGIYSVFLYQTVQESVNPDESVSFIRYNYSMYS